MKIRNIFIVITLNYILLFVVSMFLELHFLESKAKEIKTLIHTAGDMSLEQIQVVDDFMGYGGRQSYTVKMPSQSGEGFIEQDLFAGVYGLDSRNESNREAIFNRLYNTNEFKMTMDRTDAMRVPVRYFNATRTGFDWYYISRASFLGIDALYNGGKVVRVKNKQGEFMSESFSKELFDTYKMDSYKKTTGGEEYYNTPLNTGITYINEELLGSMFMNNVDLLMREKYSKNLNSPEGGNGVLRGQSYKDKISEELAPFNPINNGVFTVLRGTQNPSVGAGVSHQGVKPLVRYKVIDMYNPANDTILKSLFGSNTGAYGTKAQYLFELDRGTLNPVTMMPYTSKPIVVAQVTFYMDVVVPYSSWFMRELKSVVGEDTFNYLDINPTSTAGQGGSQRMTYTRYFAVTP